MWVHAAWLQQLLISLPAYQVYNQIVQELAMAHRKESLAFVLSSSHRLELLDDKFDASCQFFLCLKVL